MRDQLSLYPGVMIVLYRHPTVLRVSIGLYASLAMLATAIAATPSAELFPAETRGYVSVAHLQDFCATFDRTRIGQFLQDDAMQGFLKDFQRQIDRELDALHGKLGLQFHDLEGVSNGEFALAIISRPGKEAALAMVIDMTGRTEKGKALMATAEKEFIRRGGRKDTVRVDGTELLVFTLPVQGERSEQQTIYFLKNDMLCGVDDRAEAEAMLKRLGGDSKSSLATVPAFVATRERCQQDAGELAPDLHWYVDPFEFVFAVRTMLREPLKLEKDVIKILHDNGFDAIQAVGGNVNLMVAPNLEFAQRTFIYAPPLPGKENDPLRWDSSMQIMQTPNTEQLPPQVFAPQKCASYATMNVDIKTAYKYVNPVADDLIGYEDAFATTIEGLKEDPYGPQVDIGKEFIAHLGSRVTVFRDYVVPITPESERYVYAVEAIDPDALALTLAKIMESDPAAKRRNVNGVIVWRIEEDNVEFGDFEGAAFGPLGGGDFGAPPGEENGLLKNAAACVAAGHLFLASDEDFILNVLASMSSLDGNLINSPDYREVESVIREMSPGPLCGWAFFRTGEAFRPTYELIRQGRMPEAKTSVGRLLNEILTSEVEEEEGKLRTQRIDGSKLPEFSLVEKYFPPAGDRMRSVPDGWIVTGAMVHPVE